MNKGYGLPQEPYTYSKWPVRILLIVGALLLLAGGLLFRTLEQLMLVHFWVLIALLAAPIACFAVAGGLAIRHRMKGSTGRTVVTVILAFLVISYVVFVSSMCAMLTDVMNRPVAYYNSPSGESRILVACSTAYQEDGSYESYYGAYPMVNKWYYRPSIYAMPDAQTGELVDVPGILSDTGVDQVLWYEEEAGERAEVYLTDTDGKMVIIDVSFVDYSSVPRVAE